MVIQSVYMFNLDALLPRWTFTLLRLILGGILWDFYVGWSGLGMAYRIIDISAFL